MQVICSKAGTHDLCNGCGASVLHDSRDCEPCPIDETAICTNTKKDIVHKAMYFLQMAQNIAGGGFAKIQINPKAKIYYRAYLRLSASLQ